MKLTSTQNKPVTTYFLSSKERKRIDFSLEADPLFFKWQRGEATKQEWLDKVEEIESRHYE
jgi:hypothetical protein